MALPKTIANFETSLANSITAVATSLTLSTSVTPDNTALAGDFILTIDEGTNVEEHMLVTLAGSAGTIITRGLSRENGASAVSGKAFPHNRGASVKITNFVLLKIDRELRGEQFENELQGTNAHNFKIGDGTAVDNKLSANNADTNKPFIIYSEIDNAWLISNDGVNTYNPQAGGSGVTAGQGISITAGVVSTKLNASTKLVKNLGSNNDELGISVNTNNALDGRSGSPSASQPYETVHDSSNASTYTASTISFTASTKTIADSANGFVTANFIAGTQIVVTGSVSNNGTYTIVSVAAGAIVVAETLVDESAGASITLTSVTANKLVRLTSSGALPAVSGTNLTALPNSGVVPAGESLIAGDLLKLINVSGSAQLRKLIGLQNATSNTPGPSISSNLMNCWLDSNLVVFAWISGSFNCSVRAATYSSGVWTFGSHESFNTTLGELYNIGITRVSSNSFAVALRSATSGGAGNQLAARACTVSGTTITVGSESVLQTNANTGDNNTRTLKLFTLPGTSTCVCVYRFRAASTEVNSVLFTVSGTAITGGTASSAETGGTFESVTGCALSSGKFVIAFVSTGTTIKCRVATISGTTITYGTLQTITFSSTQFVAEQLETDAFVLVGRNNSTSTSTEQKLFTTSGTVVTQGNRYTRETTMTSGSGNDFSIALIGTILYVIRTDGANLLYFYKYRYGSTDGTLALMISYTGEAFGTGQINNLYAVQVYNSDRLVITGVGSGNIVSMVGNPDWDEFITSANTSYATSANVPIVQYMTGFSSLIPAIKYYAKRDEAIQGVTAASTYQLIGRAISATTLTTF